MSHFEPLPMPACSIVGCQYPCQHFRTEAADPSSGNENHATEKPGASQSALPHHALGGSPQAPGQSDHLTEGRC